MTKEEIIKELQHRATQKYLIYLALQEIMLDNYEDCKFLKDYNFYLTTKHKNMIADLKLNAAKAYKFLEGYDEGEATIKQFHEFVSLFERLHESIDKGGSLFHECLNSVEKILKDHERTQPN